ncbi:MAG: ribosome maturation factor RimM [Endomicrobiia bacterium]
MLNKKNKVQYLLEIGHIVKPHGIKGELCVFIYRNYTLEENNIVFFEKSTNLYGPYKVNSIQRHKNFLIIRTEELKSIEETQNLTGASIGIKIKKLPKNSFWVDDIVGCSVYLKTGQELGKVADVLRTGANDVYVVHNAKKTEILIPAIKQIIKKIDVKNKKIIIEPIEGLIE